MSIFDMYKKHSGDAACSALERALFEAKKQKPEAPLFVVTGSDSSFYALGHFLNSLPEFGNMIIDWKDKNQREGIALTNRENQKVGVIICYSLDARDRTLRIIKAFLGEQQ